ncbi:MAG: hypothetical protein AAFY02_14450 [Pseudomonadota bacterium]
MTKTKLSRGSKILLLVTGALLLMVLWSLLVVSPERAKQLDAALPQPPRLWSAAPPPQPAGIAGYALDLLQDRESGAVTPLSLPTLAALPSSDGEALLLRLLPNQAPSAAPQRDAQFLAAWLAELPGQPAVFLAYDWPLLEALGQRLPELILAFGSLERTLQRQAATPSPWLGGRDLSAVEGSVPALVVAAGGSLWAPSLSELRPVDMEDARAAGVAVLVSDVGDAEALPSLLLLRPAGLITAQVAAALEALAQSRGLYAPASGPQ